MRLRQLVLACGLSSFVLSPYVSALGLGEVKLKSALNQPLEAEVKLLDTRDLTADQILVTLASPADFERNGVDRLYFYTELQFQVDLESPDGPKVIIRSRNPVREPYLNFLIEARWTAGRLLREYTLLMDLPTFDEDASTAAVAAPVAAPATRQQTAPQTTYRPAPAPTRTTVPTTQATKPALNGDQYEVRANDTLWDIALRARSNSSISVHQSMMALYRANPEAFINGNINKLRRGQVLRIPDASEMTSVAKRDAVAQFAQATGDTQYGAQLNASRRTASPRTAPTEMTGRVTLAAPSGTNNAGQGSGANNGSGRALESELATTLEELDKARSENAELNARVKNLESQIETMERLVAVSNEKLRALQLSAEQVSTTATDEPAASAVAETASVQASEAAVASAVTASSVAAVQPPQPTPAKTTLVKPVRAPGLLDNLKDNPLWLALAALGVFGAGAAIYAYRRRQQAEGQVSDDESALVFDEPTAEPESTDVPTNDETDPTVEESLFEEEVETTAVAETGDVVGEADIYIAYGKLDQAEEMLLNALDKDPQSTEIRMKLLEVYAQQQNASGFDKHYSALLPIASAALLSRASELRETISGADAFSVPAEEQELTEHSVDDFSLDDIASDDLFLSESEEPLQETAGVDDDLSFDFDLSLDEENTPAASEAEHAEAGSADEIAEFDFDLSDEEVELAGDNTDDEADFLSFESDVAEVSNTSETEVSASFDEDEFTLALDELEEQGVTDDVETPAETAVEALDVAEDDFNLDMEADEVDLAALDQEMEILDVDFNDELTADDEATSETASVDDLESANEFALDFEDDAASDSNSFGLDEETELLADDLDSTTLVLTDDLDKTDDVEFAELDNELAALDEASVELGELDDQALPVDDSDFSWDEEVLAETNAVAEHPNVLDNGAADDLPALEEDSIAEAETGSAVESGQEEDLFDEALAELETESDEFNLDAYTSDEATLADLSDEEMDTELDFLADADEAATKLDLARAYIDMGDADGARDILSEVVNEGNDEQRREAAELLDRIV